MPAPGWRRASPFFAFQRRQPGHSIAVTTPMLAGARIVTLYADRSAVRFAAKAWSELSSTRLLHSLEFSSFDTGSLRQDPSVAILHLVAQPIDTGRGLRATFTPQIGRSAAVEAAADQIAAAFPALRLCILQDFPAELRARTAADRYTANITRRFCYQLHRLGIPAVIMLPPLPLDVATETISSLAQVIATRPRDGGPALERALAAIRKRIANLPFEDREVGPELAYDVVYHAPGRLNLETPETAPDIQQATPGGADEKLSA